MHEKWYGGNQISKIDNKKSPEVSVIKLSQDKTFDYFLVSLPDNKSFHIGDLKAFTVFFLNGSDGAKVSISKNGEYLLAGDSVEINNLAVDVFTQDAVANILVSGVKESFTDKETLRVVRKNDHYKVSKPWGHELWINGEHPGYSFKEVFIKRGERTSLQYHNIKAETNALISGTAKFIYKKDERIPNDEVTFEDLGLVELESPVVINVVPKVLHRIEAITDILLYETSTPHLDDVIRVSDDNARANGRIAEEHTL